MATGSFSLSLQMNLTLSLALLRSPLADHFAITFDRNVLKQHRLSKAHLKVIVKFSIIFISNPLQVLLPVRYLHFAAAMYQKAC